MDKLDCIIVGFNEINFNEFALAQKQFANVSGAYSELKTNSVLLGNERRTYMELLNTVLTKATGKVWDLNPFRMPSLGVAYLASFLARRNFSIEIINFFNTDQAKLADLLAASSRAVAITTTYYVDDEPIKQIVKFIRQHNPVVKIIVGGPRIFNICTANPIHRQNLIFRTLGADIYIHDSQGEKTLSEVLACLRNGSVEELSKVPNLIYKSDNKTWQRTERIIEENDLNENAVNWHHFNRDFYVPTTYMRTSRSCSFRCAFCNYPAMAGALTLCDLETIEAEMRYLHNAGVRNLIFVDDTFNVPLPRFKTICRMMIRNNFQFNWVSFFRCSNADDQAFDLMQQSGCTAVFLGIESGDRQILKNMNKFSTIERYQYGIQKLTERGILTLASLVIGFPGETHETVTNTIDFLRGSPTTFYNVQLYYHDTLAPIDKRREEFAIVNAGYSWKHQTMDWQEAIVWKEHMIQNITGSALLPLYGLSIWALPYLFQQGISINQVVDFASYATRLLIKGLDDVPFDYSSDIEPMVSLFQNL